MEWMYWCIWRTPAFYPRPTFNTPCKFVSRVWHWAIVHSQHCCNSVFSIMANRKLCSTLSGTLTICGTSFFGPYRLPIMNNQQWLRLSWRNQHFRLVPCETPRRDRFYCCFFCGKPKYIGNSADAHKFALIRSNSHPYRPATQLDNCHSFRSYLSCTRLSLAIAGSSSKTSSLHCNNS